MTWSRRLALVIVAAVLSTACDEDPVPDPGPLTSGSAVAALGDSYAAGEGLQPYDDERSGGDCNRSPEAHSAVLDRVSDISFHFVACSGAEILEVSSTSGSQLQAPSSIDDADIGLVLLMVGGNDLRFVDVLGHCAFNFGCLTDDSWEGQLSLEAWAEQELATMPERLHEAYRRIVVEYPNARVVVVAYPHLFAVPASVPGGHLSCAGYVALYSEGERIALNALIDRLNATIAAAAVAAGTEYVHTSDLFDGHETCGAEGPWIDFFTDSVRVTALFHPTADGQRALARLVSCYLEQHSTNPHIASIGAAPSAASIGSTPAFSNPAVHYGKAGDAVHRCAQP